MVLLFFVYAMEVMHHHNDAHRASQTEYSWTKYSPPQCLICDQLQYQHHDLIRPEQQAIEIDLWNLWIQQLKVGELRIVPSITSVIKNQVNRKLKVNLFYRTKSVISTVINRNVEARCF